MSDYGILSKLLHKLSLGNAFVGEICFDIECSVKRKDIQSSINGKHIFVSGLARAGTTMLMRALHETGEFASLTYRDMPFVLAPNMWAKISGLANIEMDKKVRVHGDGILVDFDSPEALEEIFWATFIGNSYIRKEKLLPHVVENEIIEKFRDYVALVLMRYGKSRYLSKNNNNILRQNSILEAFPCATILVPFREPLQQAYSLMKQHQKFKVEGESNPFLEQYMGWLVHHEFGSDHRPFEWGVEDAGIYEVESIDYWLLQWVSAYSTLLTIFEKQAASSCLLFVCYESICSDTTRVWGAILNKLEIESSSIPDFNIRFSETPSPNSSLKNTAHALYAKL
ncbi:sulfotransferase, partial [Shewanella vesiculosa]|uniref:sulfotransferase n=1 Tax=Shewanella vesiculosa TaxID=518738 RepID=UPI00235A1686